MPDVLTADLIKGLRDAPLIVLATLASGLLSVLAAAAIALSMARRWTPYLVSFAVGVLLTAAFLDLLPEAASRYHCLRCSPPR